MAFASLREEERWEGDGVTLTAAAARLAMASIVKMDLLISNLEEPDKTSKGKDGNCNSNKRGGADDELEGGKLLAAACRH